MTWNEYNTAVWRAAGLTDEQIAAGLAHNARTQPGFGFKQAVLAPGRTVEQAIASGVRAFNAYRALPRWAKVITQDVIDCVIEADNRKN